MISSGYQRGGFFIYNPETTQTIGAITNEFLKGSQTNPAKFSNALIGGDLVVLEYYQPASVIERPIISIDKLFYGFKAVFTYADDDRLGLSGSCNLNASCFFPEFELVGKAVSRLYIRYSDGSAGFCTGPWISSHLRIAL